MSLLAVAPALPLHAAGKYVAGAYIVFVLVILIYVTIMATRLSRTERALVELGRDIARQEEARGDAASPGAPDMATQVGREAAGRDAARLTGAGRGPGDSPL